MPTPEQILAGLTRIANQWTAVAILWHGVVAVALGALTIGWRPSKRLGSTLAAVPLASVSLLAFVEANPFNGALFGVATVVIGWLALRMPREPVRRGVVWAQTIGVAMIAYAWVYPHFLEGASWATYLYAAPLGVVPCPTLSVVVGFGLLAGGFGDRAWSGAIAGLAAVYALVGTFVLGVTLDVALLVGAGALMATVVVPSQRPPDWSETQAAAAPSASG